MREKIFRGKPKDKRMYYFFSQNWKDSCKDGFVYGSLVVRKQTENEDRYYICVTALCSVTHCVNNGITSMIEVIPETVGEYTNLTDKNGVRIFEGDIIGFIDCTSTENGYSEQYCVGEVIWCKETLSFEVSNRLSAESYEVLQECVIIGNIQDKPELVKE